MARIKNQSIPPSLRAGVARVLSIPGVTAGGGASVGLTPSARGRAPAPEPPAVLKSIRDAAEWLFIAWNPSAPAAFTEARREELRNLEFPAQYWYEVSPAADLTDYAAPTVGPYVGDLDAAYVDPLRSPTSCVYGLATDSYSTPEFPGSPQYPFPGWRGEVIDEYFRDLYFAQRRLMYDLPKRVIHEKRRVFIRPLLAVIEGQIMANASFRGVKSWFAFCVWPYLYRSEDGVPADAHYLISKWTPAQQTPLELPPEQTGQWACTANVRTLRTLVNAD